MIEVGLLHVEEVPLVVSSKLRKCVHVQILSFYIVSGHLHKPEPHYSNNHLENKRSHSLFQTHFFIQKIQPQTNLALSAVLRESSPQLSGEGEKHIDVGDTDCEE